jgi:hypothetical protein
MSKPIRYSKGSTKREDYSNKWLHKLNRHISNKQPNNTTKEIGKAKINQTQN